MHVFAIFIWICLGFVLLLIAASIVLIATDTLARLIRQHRLKHRRIAHRSPSPFDGARKP